MVEAKKPIINQHYVPRFYLRNFAINTNTDLVYSLDMTAINPTPRQSSLSQICSKDNLYECANTIKTSGNIDWLERNKTEKLLSECEQQQSKVISKILSVTSNKENFYTALICNKEEKETLFSFIVHLFLRNPAIYEQLYYDIINEAKLSGQTDWDGFGRACFKLGLNKSLFNQESKTRISYFKKYYDFLNTLSFEFLYTQNTFITSNIPITIYPVDKTEKCEIWLPLSSHVGVLFSENKKYKRNHLINRTGKTESLNCLVANNANLYYQKTALLIGSNKNCLTKAYDIVSDPHFKLSNL